MIQIDKDTSLLRLGALTLVLAFLVVPWGTNARQTTAIHYSATPTSCLVAPIGLPQGAFDTPALGTAKGDVVYSDSTYTQKPLRRFFLRDDPTAADTTPHGPLGQFAWLRWNSNEQPAAAFVAALTPPGTIGEEYLEAPRPASFPLEPTTYPDRPGIISARDVVYGAQAIALGAGYGTGVGFDGPQGATDAITVAQRLKALVDQHSYLTLPEYDLATNTIRQDARLRVRGFGGYLVSGFGYMTATNPWLRDSSGGSDLSRGYGWFLDLVHVDATSRCITDPEASVTLHGTSQIKPVAQALPAPEGVTLVGSIKIRPELASYPSAPHVPIDVVFVLDGSDSMNWTWDGFGTLSQQSAPDLLPFLPAGTKVGDPINCVKLLLVAKHCTPDDAYQDYIQRRIYKAKQAIVQLLEGFHWASTDRATVVTFHGGWPNPTPNDDPDTLTSVYPTEGFTTAILTGTNNLRDLVVNTAASANPGSSDASALYTTIGGSPAALGLQRAKHLLDTQGRADARRSIIMLTDGLFNVDLAGKQNADLQIRGNYDPTWTKELPVNLAGHQADYIKDQNNTRRADIFVLALGSTFTTSGLTYISSSKAPPFFDTANSSSAIVGVLSYLDQPGSVTCESVQLEPQVPSAERMVRLVGGGFVAVTDAAGQPILGTVTVRDANNLLVTRVDIQENGRFAIPNLLPNTTYRLSFNRNEDDPVFYLGEDNIPREYSIVAATGTDSLEWRTASVSLGTTQSVLDGTPVLLLLRGQLCLEPSATAELRTARTVAPTAATHTQTLPHSFGVRDPIDMIIVLDASGSMNWTWDGRGTMSHTLYADLSIEGALPPGAKPGDDIDCVAIPIYAKGCMSADAYKDYTQRRLYLVKQAIKTYLEDFPWIVGDRAAIVTFNGANGTIDTTTKVYPATGLTTHILGTSGSLVDLLINQAASKTPASNDPNKLYTTLGGSPGASGLQRAKQVLDSAPPAGARQRVVLFTSDGLLNVGLDGVPHKDTIGEVWDPAWQRNLPTNEANTQADLLKDAQGSVDAKVYVFAISSRFNTAGQEQLASSKAAPFFDIAYGSDSFASLLAKALPTTACELTEQAAKVPEWDRSAQAGMANPPLIGGQQAVGTVIARDMQGTIAATTTIALDGSWSLTGLEPATSYTLSFNTPYTDTATHEVVQPIVYRGDDNVYRSYTIVEGTGTDTLTIRTQDQPGTQAVAAPVVLRHAPDCPVTPLPDPTPPMPTPTTPTPPTETPSMATPTATATMEPSASATASAMATATTPAPQIDTDQWHIYLTRIRR